MELIKAEEPLEFAYGDAVFLIKRRATAHDKMQIDLSNSKVDGNVIRVSQADFADLLLRLFVVGWKGVTRDGNAVPYSYETMKSSLPTADDDFLLALTAFILDKTDIFKKDLELKKA